MPAALRLTLTDYLDPTRWRWLLSDARGGFLADHMVRLDPSSRDYKGFVDLAGYLDFYREAYPPENQLKDLGHWVGEQVFGGLRDKLWARRAQPAAPVQLIVPDQAQELLFRPFELARFGNGQSLRQAGIRFIYRRAEADPASDHKQPAEDRLRILAVFSLPVSQNPLNLRRERYHLQRFVRDLNQTQGRAVELRILQYGATRKILEDALQEGEGWDLVHLSGHGERGGLLLEDDRGGTDTIDAEELGGLLANTAERLKLLILDACYSGAGSHAAARVQLGLDKMPVRETGAQGEAVAETTRTVLPSLAQSLAERLDCAALAMRYPVGDAFATELMLSLYDKLLDRRQPLPAALHLALDEALNSDVPQPPLSFATPILLGERAAELKLPPPQRPFGVSGLESPGLEVFFPKEPPRFVGRLQPMLRASQALASRSPERGVLFHGMPGAGKTACALELAYRHAENRFAAHVWYPAPQAGSDIATALSELLLEIQRQLNAPGLGLTTDLADPARFRHYTLLKLRALLQQNSLLLVLDNLENLLTETGQWRDPLWGEVIATLLGHTGASRAMLTSRRVPADLEHHPQLQREAIHALSFAESVLLARELPHLNALFGDDEGLELLQQTLAAVQGHPKLLELADGLAADRQALRQRVAAATAESARRGENLDAFFRAGVPREGETRRSDRDFVRELQGWTAGVAAGLPATARLLFQVLAGLEPEDRRRDILDANWKDILTRLGEDNPVAKAALAEPELGLPQVLDALAKAGLAGVEPPAELSSEQQARLEAYLARQSPPQSLASWLAEYRQDHTAYPLHPGVSEAGRAAAEAVVIAATDIELGNYHIAMYRHGLETEQEGGGETVVGSARRAAPYLMRQERWEKASELLENLLLRDQSPEAVAFVLPLLRHIAEATRGSEREGIDAGLLAKALAAAGQVDAAEMQLREVIQHSVAGGHYRTAGAAAGELMNLLGDSGRLPQALELAGEKAGYTRQAGLGPWTQLNDEGRRLQVLVAMGRHAEVLAAVQALRPRMAALPETGEANEMAIPWNVREGMLDVGREAAMRCGQHDQARELNAEQVQSKWQRRAQPLELARTRFNDYGPLLSLKRYDPARNLLQDCRAVYEAEHAIPELGAVWTALADLEDETGRTGDAVRFEEIALGYKYQAGQPEGCAVSHHNLANYLERQGVEAATVLAHRLASAAIRLQSQSGQWRATVGALAGMDLPVQPPSFAAVAEAVESIDGVRFRALFERLPRTAPDGDAAIAAVWQLAAQQRQGRIADGERKRAVLAAMPDSIRAAFELDGEDFTAALRAALTALPEDEAQARFQELREAGLIGGGPTSAPDAVPEHFEPLLQAIAAVAQGDETHRAEIESVLADLNENGWKLAEPVRRLWSGERDPQSLTANLDAQDSAILRRILELMAS